MNSADFVSADRNEIGFFLLYMVKFESIGKNIGKIHKKYTKLIAKHCAIVYNHLMLIAGSGIGTLF